METLDGRGEQRRKQTEQDCKKIHKGDLRGQKWRTDYKKKLFSWTVLSSGLKKSTPAS